MAAITVIFLLCWLSTISLPRYVLSQNDTVSTNNTIVVGFMAHLVAKDMYRPSIMGGITYALDVIKKDDTLLPGYDFELLEVAEHDHPYKPPTEQTVIKAYTAMGITEEPCEIVRPDVVFGPSGDYCQIIASIAASWNQPMISYACSGHAVSDKTAYPTFARTYPTDALYAHSIVTVLEEFNWKHVTLVNGLDIVWDSTSSKLLSLFYEKNITVQAHMEFEKEYVPYLPLLPGGEEKIFKSIVAETYQKTRIYILLCSKYARVAFLMALQEAGLLTNGEYVVITIHDANVHPVLDDGFISDDDVYNDYETPAKIAAYKNLLLLVPRPPPDEEKWAEFEEQVKYYRSLPPFNYEKKESLVKVGAAYLYDAVYLWAQALQKVLDEGGEVNDGAAIIQKMLHQTYISKTGLEQYMDGHGDVGASLALESLADTDQYPGSRMRAVAHFNMTRRELEDSTEIIMTYVPLENAEIYWVKGSLPLARPVCGFEGELCPIIPDYTAEISGGTVGAIMLIAIIVFSLVYRNWKYEQALASLIWKINYKDIIFKDKRTASAYSVGSRLSMRSLDSFGSGAQMPKQIFTTIGTYHGQLVAIQYIKKKSVDISRKVKKEFKTVRDMRNDNINPFIGACVDPPNICIVSDYCSRGSLQDILENDDINLDNMFKAALISDIVKGMIYLHNSVIKSHGNLKSSNCVLDSRWVLKITGFGLHAFKEGAKKDRDTIGEHAFFRNLLWTAPELLRLETPLPEGTQKGDIYSFGIILYEIALRQGPYGTALLMPEEIIDRVRCPRDPLRPYRPITSALLEQDVPDAVIETMVACWRENPELRPDFKEARAKLKPIQKGMKSNIFDNMIQIMEKYANNLESIVEDRTHLLLEEKKKTDLLLHSMLPKSVATQLKRGNKVEAEEFEGVTIYFSDIVGFTKLSSESTPWQVIDLLNDLYTLFDSIIMNYDVYKVETIGDAYMLVSGLPIRNGDRHAAEIASTSLHLLDALTKFKIRHKPDEQLRLRIGIHSGSVCAGVVGLTMPRYCLFGDTVNTASRMESNGEPLKIHCSPTCRDVLVRIGGYKLSERGLVAMKGKGEILTYWLDGQDPTYRRESQLSPMEDIVLDHEDPVKQPLDDKTDLTTEEGVLDNIEEIPSCPTDVHTTVDESKQTSEKQVAWAPSTNIPEKIDRLTPVEEPVKESPINANGLAASVPPKTPEQTVVDIEETNVDDQSDSKSKKKKKKKKKKKSKSKDKKDDGDGGEGLAEPASGNDDRRVSADSRTALLYSDDNDNTKQKKTSSGSEQIPLIDVIAPGATAAYPIDANETESERTKQKDSLTDSGVGNSREGSNHDVPV